ncbi:hypothetical protein LSH36_32g13038 [Paralvinella palmiformis]|uniref:Uncharacterized protein n=1 Tax=Paralvinella palmiformis TaxID=53620 RepID=A0AAD9NG64_9ANNE|nr:hypothetical protein LSH36_32g13038 [Paralvinella palmiformis]
MSSISWCLSGSLEANLATLLLKKPTLVADFSVLSRFLESQWLKAERDAVEVIYFQRTRSVKGRSPVETEERLRGLAGSVLDHISLPPDQKTITNDESKRLDFTSGSLRIGFLVRIATKGDETWII